MPGTKDTIPDVGAVTTEASLGEDMICPVTFIVRHAGFNDTVSVATPNLAAVSGFKIISSAPSADSSVVWCACPSCSLWVSVCSPSLPWSCDEWSCEHDGSMYTAVAPAIRRLYIFFMMLVCLIVG